MTKIDKKVESQYKAYLCIAINWVFHTHSYEFLIKYFKYSTCDEVVL